MFLSVELLSAMTKRWWLRGGRALAGGMPLVVVLVVLGCGVGPGGVPVELEGSLLALEDVGRDFVEEYRGSVRFDVAGSLCPSGRELAGDAVEVLSSESTSAGVLFVSRDHSGADPGDRDIEQFVVTAEEESIARGMSALEAGFEECYGLTWTVDGEDLTVEPLELPEVGGRGFAVLLQHFATIRIAYLETGDMFSVVSLEEIPDPSASPVETQTEFDRIVGEVAARLMD